MQSTLIDRGPPSLQMSVGITERLNFSHLTVNFS